MRRRGFSTFSVLVTLPLILLVSCSGPGGPPPPPPTGNAQVTVTVTSGITQVPRITILAFDVSVVGLTMTSSSGASTTLISAANFQPVELTRLQTDSVSLGTFSVPAGTYNSMTATFLPLSVTVFNQTGSTLLLNCFNNTVCTLPSPPMGAIAISASPFPVSLATTLQTGLQLTFDIGNLIKNDLTLDFTRTGILAITSLPLRGQPAGQLTAVDDQIGRITSLDVNAKTFTLQTARGNFSVISDANTQFDGFTACFSADTRCLKNDQSVSVDLGVRSDGTFLAREIQFEDPVFDEELEGVIFKVDSATQFEVVPTVLIPGTTNVLGPRIGVGSPVVVQLPINPTNPLFEVDKKGFFVPDGSVLRFQNATNTTELTPGQMVEIRVKGPGTSGGTGNFPGITTDRVRLRFTRTTAQITGAVNPPNFLISGLPPLFGGIGPVPNGPFQVQTFMTGQPQTTFENVTDVFGLSDGNIVAIRALLFKNSVSPFSATKVRKR